MITTYQNNGLTYFVLENAQIKAEWLPAIGGKMISLVDKSSDSQLVGTSLPTYSNSSLPYYGASYIDFDLNGYDECFPTIESSSLLKLDQAFREQSVHYPDHGEVWSLPWDVYTNGDMLIMQIKGIRKEYMLQKQIYLQKNTINIDYVLTNVGKKGFKYLWAANLILHLTEKDRIMLPSVSRRVLIDHIGTTELGQSGDFILQSAIFEYNNDNPQYFSFKGVNSPLRIYTDQLTSGECAIYYNNFETTLILQFNPRLISYCAIEVYDKHVSVVDAKEDYLVSLYPSTGRSSSLLRAIQAGEDREIRGYEVKDWSVKMVIT